MIEEVKISLTDEQKERIFLEAAKSLLNHAINGSHQLDNLDNYIRERCRELDCGVELPETSKELRSRYGLRSNPMAIGAFAIIEDWFNQKILQNKND